LQPEHHVGFFALRRDHDHGDRGGDRVGLQALAHLEPVEPGSIRSSSTRSGFSLRTPIEPFFAACGWRPRGSPRAQVVLHDLEDVGLVLDDGDLLSLHRESLGLEFIRDRAVHPPDLDGRAG
jgi:hypothetical protein